MPYILESNPHHFYSFRGLKNQMRIRTACGLDSRSWPGFWKNDRAAVRAVRTIQYNLLFYLLFIILYNILYNIINDTYNNKLFYFNVPTARTAALSFFQNPAHDGESNPHAILIRIRFFSPLKLWKERGLDSRIYGRWRCQRTYDFMNTF